MRIIKKPISLDTIVQSGKYFDNMVWADLSIDSSKVHCIRIGNRKGCHPKKEIDH